MPKISEQDVERIARRAVAEVAAERSYRPPQLQRIGWARPGDIIFLKSEIALNTQESEAILAAFEPLDLKVVVLGPGLEVIEDPQRSSLTVPDYPDPNREVPLNDMDFDRMSQDDSEPPEDGVSS